ncbi:MAG TPA: tetratricopeptide repeat protein [Solirubrobacteraceae bacterium]|nr:tetratricopeptide repeat protein [Solirubrobacteraceae bacterium]
MSALRAPSPAARAGRNPPGITVALLGGFTAAVDGQPVPDRAWRLKKARELVKLLALAPGHRLHREQAMDVLWQDREPAAAANNLHQAVYAARRALVPDAIEVREEMLQLVAEVDVDRLKEAAEQAFRKNSAAAYRAALALYAGELLPENRYDDWADGHREELVELAQELEQRMAALGPTSEDSPLVFPVEASSFIGRRRELDELIALLPNARMVTLAGTGGVGKTRMALELARRAAPSYPDGAALVELSAVTDPELVGDTLAAALDVHALSGQKALDAVADYLVTRSLLLVIDNCEHVVEAAAEIVDSLLRRAPALCVLATSRAPLRVAGELLFRVPSLQMPDPERLCGPDELLEYEAVRLFVERAGAAAPEFVLDEHNARDIARICFRLDGLPLALELAAARLGALGPAAIAERLDDRFRVLRTASHRAPTRQRTLLAALDWSHDLLEEDERTLLRRLAVFSGGFELEAAETVCAGAGLDRLDIADVLGRLVEKSMVVADARSSRERRYRLLETVRMYAQARLDEAGETGAVAEHHVHWALELTREWGHSPRLDRDAANLRVALDSLFDRDPGAALGMCLDLLPFWLRRIDLDEGRRRFDKALAATRERTMLRARALLAAASIDLRSGAVGCGIARAEESHAIAVDVADGHGQWRALQLRAEFALASDAADAAIPRLEQALELARRESLAAAEATSLNSLGIAYWMLGDLARGEQLLADSTHLYDALAGSSEPVNSPVSLAETLRSGGRRGLRIVFEDTLQPFAETSSAAAVGYALANQAGIARARGDLLEARALLDESELRFTEAGDESGRAAALVRRAYLELAEGDPQASRRTLEEAGDMRRDRGDRRGMGVVLAGLGLIDTTAGDYAGAERHLAEAETIFERAGDRWGLAVTLWRIADLELARGRLDDAEAALQRARRVLGPTQRERWIANTVAGLAEIALEQGNTDRAVALLHDARDRYESRHDMPGVADVDERLRAIAKALQSRGKDTRPTTLRTPE